MHCTRPWVDDTISRETLDCLRERDESRPAADSLLLSIEAKKSSLVASAG